VEAHNSRIRNTSGPQLVRSCFCVSTFSELRLTLVLVLVGGWWVQPSNWRSNTAIVFTGILAITYGVFTVSADREVCHDLS
jgi:FtsH-binding integral membrane protein